MYMYMYIKCDYKYFYQEQDFGVFIMPLKIKKTEDEVFLILLVDLGGGEKGEGLRQVIK